MESVDSKGPHRSCDHGGECCSGSCGPVYRHQDVLDSAANSGRLIAGGSESLKAFRRGEISSEEYPLGVEIEAQAIAERERARRAALLEAQASNQSRIARFAKFVFGIGVK